MRRPDRTAALVVLLLLAAVLLLTGCVATTPVPVVDLAATEAAIRAEVLATVTAEAPVPTATPEAASTPEPTAAASATSAVPPTSTAEPTATASATVTPTHTPPPTAAPTQAPVPVSPTPEPAASAPSEYTVQSGDSLSKIASGLGVSVAALSAYNGIADPGAIYVGQVIKVPPADYVAPTAEAVPTLIPTHASEAASTQPEATPSAEPVSAPPDTEGPEVQVQFTNLHYECQMRCLGGDSPIWSYRSFQMLMTIVNTSGDRTIEPPWRPTRWIITDGVNTRTDDLVFVWYGPGGQAYAQPPIPAGGAAEWTFVYPNVAEPEWIAAVEFELWGRTYRQDLDIGPAKTKHNYSAVCGTIPLDTSCGR